MLKFALANELFYTYIGPHHVYVAFVFGVVVECSRFTVGAVIILQIRESLTTALSTAYVAGICESTVYAADIRELTVRFMIWLCSSARPVAGYTSYEVIRGEVKLCLHEG